MACLPLSRGLSGQYEKRFSLCRKTDMDRAFCPFARAFVRKTGLVICFSPYFERFALVRVVLKSYLCAIRKR